jgi:FKBP-type peptidyl-prolyl cis-trans isomerase
MRKLPTIAITALAGGAILFGYARAQQTPPAAAPKAPAASPSQTPATKTPSTAAKSGTTAAKKPAVLTLKTTKEKASYAIGLNWGKSMHRDSVDLDPNIILRGLKDGMAGGKTLMTDDEAKAAIDTFQVELRTHLEDANKKEGDDFLAANKTKEGVVTLPSGLEYKILKEGTGPTPTLTDTVICNYKGTLLNKTEFDSSYKRGQPVTFPVNGVIKGWTEALQLMPVGSKWQLFIPSELAYGKNGAPRGGIGPNSTLVFEVELVSIQAKAQPSATAPSAAPNPAATTTPSPASTPATGSSPNPTPDPKVPPTPTPSPNPKPIPTPTPNPHL